MNKQVAVTVATLSIVAAANLLASDAGAHGTKRQAAKAEPIPADAAKTLVDRLGQIAVDKDKTAAQRAASLEDALNDFCTKYGGHSVTLNYRIKDVIKYDVAYLESGRIGEIAPNHVLVQATDSGSKYAIQINSPDSTSMLFGELPKANYTYYNWLIPEKNVLAINKNKDRLVLTATFVGRTFVTLLPKIRGPIVDLHHDEVALEIGHVGTGKALDPYQLHGGHLSAHDSSSEVFASLVLKDLVFKVISGADTAAGNPKARTEKR